MSFGSRRDGLTVALPLKYPTDASSFVDAASPRDRLSVAASAILRTACTKARDLRRMHRRHVGSLGRILHDVVELRRRRIDVHPGSLTPAVQRRPPATQPAEQRLDVGRLGRIRLTAIAKGRRQAAPIDPGQRRQAREIEQRRRDIDQSDQRIRRFGLKECPGRRQSAAHGSWSCRRRDRASARRARRVPRRGPP